MAGFASFVEETNEPSEMYVFGAICDNTTSPAEVAKSASVPPPVWKSDCVVSTKHAPAGAASSAKFFVVVLLSDIATLLVLALMYPGALTVSVGYVPAGTENE